MSPSLFVLEHFLTDVKTVKKVEKERKKAVRAVKLSGQSVLASLIPLDYSENAPTSYHY